MKEQAVGQSSLNTPASKTSRRRLAISGHRIRMICVLLLVTTGAAAVYFLYGDATREKIDPDEIRPVIISSGPSTESVVSNVSTEKAPVAAVTAGISQETIELAEHPLDPLLEMAHAGADYVRENVRDYTATIVKRVRWKGRLQDEQYVACKIRHAVCTSDPETSVPFSVYTRFLKPKPGQEAIWVEGCHDDKIIAHGPPGLLNVMTFRLDPEGGLAMNGNRYPIRNIGMLNLILQMIEKGERDRRLGDCEVKITRDIKVGDTRCTRLEIIHEEKQDAFDFYRAEIYIDDDRNLPIAYRGFSWPDEPGGKPKLVERYFYRDIRINVGLTDRDFDPANPEYKFPGK